MPHFVEFDKEESVLYCQDSWVLANLNKIKQELTAISRVDADDERRPGYKTTRDPGREATFKLTIDGSGIKHIDSSGALMLRSFHDALSKKKVTVKYANFKEAHENLLKLTEEREKELEPEEKPPEKLDIISRLGKATVEHVQRGIAIMSYVGELTLVFKGILFSKRELQWRTFFRTIEDAGFHALPILALLSFLIGVVLAYQLGLQLKNYGANVYIVNLSGMAILREFGPLITAIIVAGRTGSAFTAQIGLMKVNEEIDALSTMGLSPINRIAIPRVLAIIITMPLLTIWSIIFGIFGSMVMSQYMLGINMTDFISRFNQVIVMSDYWTGMAKTPVFGIAIAIVGCFQGFQVNYTAESIGQRTTMSVVQSLFLIIIIDAVFSVLYSWAKI